MYTIAELFLSHTSPHGVPYDLNELPVHKDWTTVAAFTTDYSGTRHTFYYNEKEAALDTGKHYCIWGYKVETYRKSSLHKIIHGFMSIDEFIAKWNTIFDYRLPLHTDQFIFRSDLVPSECNSDINSIPVRLQTG